MIDKDLVKSKMADMQGYLQELHPILERASREIIEDNLKLHTVERLFQVIVDTAIDINIHIIMESDFTVPDDYQSTFITLGEHKILSMDFAVKIAPSVGLRNLVVHKYGRVDIKRMVEDIRNEIGDYIDYLKFIDGFLSS
ncbi:MAG: HepT-like ribonuclease domain-containing protein [Patescibacteria group bacterium]